MRGIAAPMASKQRAAMPSRRQRAPPCPRCVTVPVTEARERVPKPRDRRQRRVAEAEDEQIHAASLDRRRRAAPARHSARTSGSALLRRAPAASAANVRRRQQARRRPRPPWRAPAARHRRGAARPRAPAPASAGIADGDQDVADEAVAAGALDRRAGEPRAERRIVEAGEVRRAAAPRDRRAARSFASRPGLRELVPGADGQAIVAAEDPVADARPQLRRDMALVLDGQVGDAAPRIEPIGRRKGVGRADVEAAPAGAATVRPRARRPAARRW